MTRGKSPAKATASRPRTAARAKPTPKVKPTSKVKISVGRVTAEELRRDFLAAIKRAESGKAQPDYHLTFANWDLLTQALTPKRLELIRYVKAHRVGKITELARGLRRDYRNVHDDVRALTEAGLLEKAPEGFRAPYDSIQTVIAF